MMYYIPDLGVDMLRLSMVISCVSGIRSKKNVLISSMFRFVVFMCKIILSEDFER